MKQLLFFLLLMGVGATASAQLFDDWTSGGERFERVRAQRVAYITGRMNLTPAESQAFWPLINELEGKMQEVKNRYQAPRNIESIGEAEARKLIEQQLKREQELQALRAEYVSQALEVVPAQKLILFPKADKEFKRNLLNELRRRRR